MKHWQECAATETFKHCDGRVNADNHLENSMAVSYKVEHILTFQKGQQFYSLVFHPEKLKTYVQTKTCMQMFITALFVRPKLGGQTNCGIIHIMEYSETSSKPLT